MKKFLIYLGLLVTSIALFVLYTFFSTGYFREINNSNTYEIISKIPLKGAEDLTISYDDEFMIISQDDRAARLHNRKRTGNLCKVDLKQENFEPILLDSRISMYPHGISMIKIDSGHYQLLVVNHFQKHTIEKFDLYNDSLVHLETYEDDLIISPNDVVFLHENTFYFTNDHGYTSKVGLLAENYLGLNASNVVYYDGSTFQMVADGIGYANGINISSDRSQLLVASPRKFQLKYYDIGEDGSLTLEQNLAVGSGIDNIELDQDGNLWMGAHPNLLAYTAYATGKKSSAPAEIIHVSADGAVESLYENDGSSISGPSVAAPYQDFLFVGTVMDDFLYVLKKKG